MRSSKCISTCKLILTFALVSLVMPDQTASTAEVNECIVKTKLDSRQSMGSIRSAVEDGLNHEKGNFCKTAIILESDVTLDEPLVLNVSTANFTLRASYKKDAEGNELIDVNTGEKLLETRTIDLQNVNTEECAIELRGTNPPIVEGITFSGMQPGKAVCVYSSEGTYRKLTFTNNSFGIAFKEGAKNNTLTQSTFSNNKKWGVFLEDGNNIISHNFYLNNGDNSNADNNINHLNSPYTAEAPVIERATMSDLNTAYFEITLPITPNKLEFYRTNNNEAVASFVMEVNDESPDVKTAFINKRLSAPFENMGFQESDKIFAIAITGNRTSPMSNIVDLSESEEDAKCNPPGIIRSNVKPFCIENYGYMDQCDSDGDGIFDRAEDANSNCVCDGSESCAEFWDSDNDGLGDGDEIRFGTEPTLSKDSDGDGLLDGQEVQYDSNDEAFQITDPTKIHSDSDQLPDNVEFNTCNFATLVPPVNVDQLNQLCTLNPLSHDTDGDGLSDDKENLNSDFGLTDTDGDGIVDVIENLNHNSNPDLTDTDGDGLLDFEEDIDRDGFKDANETDPNLVDSDGDVLSDDKDSCPVTETNECNKKGHCPKMDLGYADGEGNNGLDYPRKQDSDGDGIFDYLEDADEDCTDDSNETKPLEVDSDEDNLEDGVEDDNQDGQVNLDVDGVPTETDPRRKDSDKDGIHDGAEDRNHDGKFQSDDGETDPRNADSDGDGLDDYDDPCPLKDDPNCACDCYVGVVPLSHVDSDKDGLPNYAEDSNNDCVWSKENLESNACEADTDNDGMNDLNETTYPTDLNNPDTDGYGILDGAEDYNGNGEHDKTECNAKTPDTDKDGITDDWEDTNKNGLYEIGLKETQCYESDTDKDDIPDGVEDKNGNNVVDVGETDPRLTDTDGDGPDDLIDPHPLNYSDQDNKAVDGRTNSGCSLTKNSSATNGSTGLGLLMAFMTSLGLLFISRQRTQC